MKTPVFAALFAFLLVSAAGCGPATDDQQGALLAGEVSPATVDPVDWESHIAYQRGLEAMIWAMPAVSMISMRRGNFTLGGGYNTVYWLSSPPTALQEALTANNQTPYATVHLNTHEGPVVLDVPPATDRTAIFGSAVDVFQVPIADIGPAGTDEGRGGRYLFLPPGYDGAVPEGFFPVELDLFEVYVALRCIPLGDAGYGEAAEYSKQINAYPFAQADSPPDGFYVDQSGKHVPTLPAYDLSLFETIAELVNEEPVLEQDKVLGGMLASIGIEKGKPFEPTGAQREALRQAAAAGKDFLDHMFVTPGYSTYTYWPDRQWQGLRQPSETGFVFDEGDYLLLDERASLFHWATFVPRQLGKASAYLLGLRDAEGALLSGDGAYRLRVPVGIPARDFWSVIAYGMDTKAFIYNEVEKVGISSYDAAALDVNPDGSIDVYFGQEAPAGLESNWIPTAGEDFFILFRFYGPEDAFFDKSFVLPDVERIR
jgi:hypothetical protein